MLSKESQSAYALIKFFSKEEHYANFLSGVSLFRTPHYYRTCEDPGRGDRNESCLLFWDHILGGDKPNILQPDGTHIDYKKLKSVLIYTADEQYDTWMQSWAVLGAHNSFENSIEKMQKEFGSYFVLLPANKINQYRTLVEKTSGYRVKCGMVRYSSDLTERSLTVKDSKYSYQKEFRFFTGQCSKGELKDKFLILKGLDKLLLDAKSLKITSPNGSAKYCSVGHSGTVTV